MAERYGSTLQIEAAMEHARHEVLAAFASLDRYGVHTPDASQWKGIAEEAAVTAGYAKRDELAIGWTSRDGVLLPLMSTVCMYCQTQGGTVHLTRVEGNSIYGYEVFHTECPA